MGAFLMLTLGSDILRTLGEAGTYLAAAAATDIGFAITIIVAGFAGGYVCNRVWKARVIYALYRDSAVQQVQWTQAIDRSLFLQTLRREIANALIWHDPQRYLRLYRKLHDEVTSLESEPTEKLSTWFDEMCKEYPNYADFDHLGTREYILYADIVGPHNLDELEKRYRDLVRFAALAIAVEPAWVDNRFRIHTTDTKELEHLTGYIRRVEDTKFKWRIDQAMNSYYCFGPDKLESLQFENDLYVIKRDVKRSYGENYYDIHFKITDEFAIYSFYVFDDGRTSCSYYRSDAAFQTLGGVNFIRIEDCPLALRTPEQDWKEIARLRLSEPDSPVDLKTVDDI